MTWLQNNKYNKCILILPQKISVQLETSAPTIIWSVSLFLMTSAKMTYFELNLCVEIGQYLIGLVYYVCKEREIEKTNISEVKLN